MGNYINRNRGSGFIDRRPDCGNLQQLGEARWKSERSLVRHHSTTQIETFQMVTEARSAVMGAKTVKQAAEAEKEMQGALGKIFAIAEAYPELKANSNFVKLQEQLQDVEDKIQAARRFYNAGAKELNTKIKTFPTNLVNSIIGHFKKRDYFEVADSEKAKIEKAPDVKF